MNKKPYLQPIMGSYRMTPRQCLLTASTLEAEVYDVDFDEESMDALSRQDGYDLWADDCEEEEASVW